MNITVYCSSSGALEPHFADGARALGSALAVAGLTMVYGGGSAGLMGECARAAKAGGGQVIGIITGKLDALEHGWRDCDELQVVETMPERRTRMMDLADGYVVLPGGLGTYEEFFEVLVSRQLGDHGAPIVIVNHQGYYDPLIAMIEHGIAHRFIRPAIREALVVVDTAEFAVPALLSHEAPPHDPSRFLFLPEDVEREKDEALSLAS